MDFEVEIEELRRQMDAMQQMLLSKMKALDERIQKNGKLYHELNERLEDK